MQVKDDKRPHWSFKSGCKTIEMTKDELAQILNEKYDLSIPIPTVQVDPKGKSTNVLRVVDHPRDEGNVTFYIWDLSTPDGTTPTTTDE